MRSAQYDYEDMVAAQQEFLGKGLAVPTYGRFLMRQQRTHSQTLVNFPVPLANFLEAHFEPTSGWPIIWQKRTLCSMFDVARHLGEIPQWAEYRGSMI